MNKNVFITGACKNTGLGIAERFAKEGYNVFITCRKKEEALSAESYIKEKYKTYCKGYKLDSDEGEEAVKTVFNDLKEKGYLIGTVVLNAANLGINQNFFEMTVRDIKEVFETNVFWNFTIVQQAVSHMLELKKGSIVFVNSNTAYRMIPDRLSYESSKGAILSMSRALAFDLGKYNIRSNCVLPGMIKTDRWENNYNNCKNAPSNFTPIGDIADCGDIADAVFYFAGDGAKNTTGAELIVDGGNMIQLYPIIK